MKIGKPAPSWKPSTIVLVLSLASMPPAPAIEIADELFVDLDALSLDEGPGADQWTSAGSLGDFVKVGDPVVETIAGARAVSFNSVGSGDSYQSLEPVPPGLVGADPTRSIEAWVYNPFIVPEEAIVGWGKRGGPDGSNMSFNYGTNDQYGAVGHWNLNFQDIGWTAVPIARQWHHLVYTFDGTTTRVYVDGALDNSEVLGAGAINTFGGMPIALAQQYLPDGIGFETLLPGRMSIGKLRVHDGVLSGAQVLANYNEERPRFPFDNLPPVFLDAPATDTVLKGLPYSRSLRLTGYPLPGFTVLPAGGTASLQVAEATGELNAEIRYLPPDPPPASFTLTVKGTNSAGFTEVSWTVNVKDPSGSIEVAEDLVVDLDARDLDEGLAPDTWLNHGSMGDFQLVTGSEATVSTLYGARAVNFNACLSNDAYRSVNDAPDGIVGPDPTVSVEAWVLNASLADEEAVVEWGKRGGPDGTEMSFSYSLNAEWGAVGHWGAGPNMGWGVVPAAGQWHHLVYTFDGSIQRVYSDGLQSNFEVLGNGSIDTFTPAPVFLAVQTEPDGITPSWPFRGSLSIARVRIHDGVLTPAQIQNNYLAEKGGFGDAPPPSDPVAEKIPLEPVHRYTFDAGPEDVIGSAHGTTYGNVTFENGQAVLNNVGTEVSSMNGQSPPGAPPGAYIDLPNGVISGLGNQATIETWATWNGPAGAIWQRIFDFGSSDAGENFSSGAGNSYYLFVTPRAGQNTFHFGYRNAGAPIIARFIETPALPVDDEHHIVVVWDGASCTTSFFIDGEKIGENSTHFDLNNFTDVNNWLGRSNWVDAMFRGRYNELRLYDYALTPNQVLGNYDAGPDVLNTPPPRAEVVRGFSQPTFDLGQPFGVSLAITLHAPDSAAGIEEVFPAGTSVSEISDGGLLNGDRIAWSLTGISQKTVSYKVSPPADCTGSLNWGNSTWNVSGTPGHVTGLKKISMTVGGGSFGAWQSADIGDPEGGAVRLADREMLLRGGGKGVINTASDGFQYLHLPVSGDFELSAKIDCADDPGAGGLAGLMVRESLDPFAAHLFISLSSVPPLSGSGLGTLRCDFRRETLATRASQTLLAFQPKDVDDTSVYLKIRRANNPTTQARTIYFERSADGVTWSPLSSKVIGTTASQINLKEDALIGLAVTGGGKGFSQYSFRDVHGVPEVPVFSGGTAEPLFKRGDVDGTGVVELTDVINLIGFLFLGNPANLDCFDAADVDDTGIVELTDAIVEIGWLFLGDPKNLPAPGPFACGADAGADDLAACNRACQ